MSSTPQTPFLPKSFAFSLVRWAVVWPFSAQLSHLYGNPCCWPPTGRLLLAVSAGRLLAECRQPHTPRTAGTSPGGALCHGHRRRGSILAKSQRARPKAPPASATRRRRRRGARHEAGSGRRDAGGEGGEVPAAGGGGRRPSKTAHATAAVASTTCARRDARRLAGAGLLKLGA